MDVSEYLIDAFRTNFGPGEFHKDVDEENNPVLIVNLLGFEEFEIDLISAESSIIDEGIDPDKFVQSVIESVKLFMDDPECDQDDKSFSDMSVIMEMVIEAIERLDLPFQIADPVNSKYIEGMCIGLWINIGQHPVPFYFKDAWENIVRKQKSPDIYVKEIIVQHVGKIPKI